MPERTNGKKHTINVNQIVYKELHRPQVVDGDLTFPIYTKVDGYRGNAVDTRAETSKKYLDKSKSHFNSANNIRKIYITHNKIYIDYYKSPGNQALKLPYAAQATLAEDLLDALPKMATYARDLSAYQMERNINPKAVGPDLYEIKGNLLGVINQLYTCSNIEEIYFDWTYMFTADIQHALLSKNMGSLVGEGAIAAFLNKQPPCNGFIRSDIWESWFKINALASDEQVKMARDPSKFRDKYPRLKLIAMVSNLGDIMDMSIRSHSLLSESRQGGDQTWLTKNVDLINSSGSVVIASIMGNIQGVNTKFVTQESTYLFDRQFVDWIKTFKTSVEDYVRQSKYGTAGGNTGTNSGADSAEQEMDMNAVEQRLLAIESEVGPDKFRNILMSTVGCGFKINELKSIFRSFTKPNRTKWAKIINLSLD